MQTDVRIFAVPSSATAPEESAGHVIVSGSYGGEYNAWHAAKRGIRGVVLCDAGIGFDGAGINGLPYLDRVGLPAATADVMTCHIGDGEHILEHGRLSFVNDAARALGIAPGDTVRAAAERMRAAPVVTAPLPEISGGKRTAMGRSRSGRPFACLDAAPMMAPEDAGGILVTGSHAALFRGQPDSVISQPLFAVFFNDGGVGLDGAGVARLPTLNADGVIAGAVSATSAPIGNARAIYEQGVLYHLNRTAIEAGAAVGMRLKAFIAMLLER